MEYQLIQRCEAFSSTEYLLTQRYAAYPIKKKNQLVMFSRNGRVFQSTSRQKLPTSYSIKYDDLPHENSSGAFPRSCMHLIVHLLQLSKARYPSHRIVGTPLHSFALITNQHLQYRFNKVRESASQQRHLHSKAESQSPLWENLLPFC